MKLGGGSDSKKRKLEKRIDKAKRPQSTYQDALMVGVAFCIFAGVLFAVSAAVSWAEIKMPDSTTDHRYFVDLVRVSGNFGLLWIMPFGGIALAVTSVAQLSRTIVEGRWKREVAFVTLALALMTSLISIISIFWLQDLLIRPAGNAGSYGPGVFLSVFGAVLAIAGSLTLFADVMRDEEKSELPERWAKSREKSEEKEYVLPPEKPRGKGLKCPKCGAQVKSSWDECPICGAELD
jgi:Kef-type K+ transport system membrane component KefB